VIAVTGAGGYVGGRLVQHLADADIPVRALVRHHRPWLDRPHVEQVVGDAAAFADADAVVHLAAPNEIEAAADPAGTTAAAVVLAHQVAASAVAQGVPRLVLASTVHVYGSQLTPGPPVSEDLRCEPRHPYAVARLAAEHLMATVTDATDTDLVVFRLCNAVGAPAAPDVDRWSLLVNDLARAGVERGELVLRTDGLQWRDFLPLVDVCRVFAMGCRPDRMPAGTYNLGSGTPRTVRAVAEAVVASVRARTGREARLVAPDPTGDAPERIVVDVSRLAATGALDERSSLEDAIDEVVDACEAAAPS
jgi:UDP-glucose 4-epimerase